MGRYIVLITTLFLSFTVNGQQKSSNGWYLPTQDTLRIFVAFVEVAYDIKQELDPLPKGKDLWKVNALPQYADSLFNPFSSKRGAGRLTEYYREISFDNLVVLGDYYPEIISVPYSEIENKGNNGLYRKISEHLAESEPYFSKHGLSIDQFDFWEDSGGVGKEKERRAGSFSGVDHFMIIVRNHHSISGGMASGASFGEIAGKPTDTFSVFPGGHGFPFSFLRHEVNHLLLGGNNFHCGGGNGARFVSYFPFVQGGWSMMGAANSSLMTCNAWDRLRMAWKLPEKQFFISAIDRLGKEINTDILNESGAGSYVLRDFVTTGDAIRIKLPFIPESEYPQWLWLENHLTETFNDSQFDKFQYQDHSCSPNASPGIYIYMQVDAEQREGNNIYGSVNADYLRPIPAEGNYDFVWGDSLLELELCVTDEAFYPYALMPEFENPLSGNHVQEIPYYYNNSDLELGTANMRGPQTRKIGDKFERLSLFGNERQAFRVNGNKVLGIGTNPSSAGMLTMINARSKNRSIGKSNRKVYLTGIRVELIETLGDGSIRLDVSFNDTLVLEKRRWCAPEIVLNNHNSKGSDLYIKGELSIDRGETMTRFDRPDRVSGKNYFTDPTKLIIGEAAEICVKGTLNLMAEGELRVNPNGTLTLLKGSRLIIKDNSTVTFRPEAIYKGQGRIEIEKGSIIETYERETYIALKKATCNKKRLRLLEAIP